MWLSMCASAAAKAPTNSFVSLDDVHYRFGDDPAWASPSFDDSRWPQAKFWQVPGADEVVWIRGDFTVGPRPATEPLGLYVAALATCEVHWDGELLPPQGRVGATPEAEVPGPIEFLFYVPDRLAEIGNHHLALRCSTHHRHFEPSFGFWLVIAGPYGELNLNRHGTKWKSMLSLSGMLIFSIFSLTLFTLEPNDRSHLFLGLFCLAGAALLVAESWRILFPYTYNWHLLRLSVIAGLVWALGLLLNAFLFVRFRLPKGGTTLLLAAVLAAFPIFLIKPWDGKHLATLGILALLALVLAVQATRRGERGSWLVVLGLLVGFLIALADPGRFVDHGLYLALDFLLVCLLIAHAFQLRRTRDEREEARLKSARLEIELLKRHLQPHFLMNTLTALTEWVEEEPTVASRMIQSLAEEFRLLADISNRKLISMAEELRLCRYHLEIMSRRRGRTFRLETHDVDATASVPPAVIHTLVENALTHTRHVDSEVTFHLRQENTGDSIRWIFEAPLGADVRAETSSEGTGLRYIRARLREGYGDHPTRLSHGPRQNVWRTEIVVPTRDPQD